MARQKTIVLAFSLLLLAGSLAAGPLQAQQITRTRGNTEVTGGGFVETSNGLPIGVPETVGGFYGEQLQRYDSPEPWRHGYFQEIPAYGGFAAFRPYNYKHVLAQSQAAGGWGMSPTMPYSQQFWHRYRERAGMRKRISTRMNDPRFRETSNIVPSGSERRFAVRQYAAPSRQTPRQYSHVGGNDIRSRTPQLTFPPRR